MKVIKCKDFFERSSLILVILNNYLGYEKNNLFFEYLWKSSDYKICADGGANRLFDVSKDLIPNVICGDLDSLKSEVRGFYEAKNVDIVKYEDQDSTDLEKCILYLKNKYPGEELANMNLCVFNAFGGRFDHEMQHVNFLFKEEGTFNQIFLMSPVTLALLVLPGTTKIVPFKELESGTCGLIPINGESNITTSGLKWDVKNWKTNFGGNISTSNEVLAEQVFIKTTSPLLWSSHLESNKFCSKL